MSPLCRLCLREKLGENFVASVTTNFLSVKEKLKLCVAEIDMDITENPIVCTLCMKLLDVAYQFKCRCLQSDQRIRECIKIKNMHVNSKITEPSKFAGVSEPIAGDAINLLLLLDECENSGTNWPPNANFAHVKLEMEVASADAMNVIESEVRGETFKPLTSALDRNISSSLLCPTKEEAEKQSEPLVSSEVVPQATEDSPPSPTCDTTPETVMPPDIVSNSSSPSTSEVLIPSPGQGPIDEGTPETSAPSNFSTSSTIDSGQNPFRCNACDYTCNEENSLKEHQCTGKHKKPLQTQGEDANSKRIRQETEPALHKEHFECYNCCDRFSTKSELRNHIKVHAPKKRYACNMCDYKGKSKNYLEVHLRTHTGEKPFSCTICHYTSTMKSNLQKHMNIHSFERPFKCEYCSFTASTKKCLVLHTRTHTGEKPYQCKFCDYKSASQSALLLHVRGHTGEKPYKCRFCDYRSSRGRTLKFHEKTHTKEKSHRCDICDLNFSRKSALRRHFKRAHENQAPFECELCRFNTGMSNLLNKDCIDLTDE